MLINRHRNTLECYFVFPTERAQGCVGYRLSLSCPELKVIEVSDVVLGNSKCYWGSCCINDQACTENANANHVMDVQHRCNGQSNCTVDVIEEVITCGYFGFGTYNDFESITYTCGADSQSGFVFLCCNDLCLTRMQYEI